MITNIIMKNFVKRVHNDYKIQMYKKLAQARSTYERGVDLDS